MAFRVRIPTDAEIVAKHPWQPGTTQTWSMKVARRFYNLRRSAERAEAAMMAAIPPEELTGDRPATIRRAVARIYGGQLVCGAEKMPGADVKPFNPELLDEHASRLPANIRKNIAGWLGIITPASIYRTMSGYLDVVHPGQKALVSTNMHQKGGFVYEGPHEAKSMEDFARGHRPYVVDGKVFCGAWYLANPIDGEWRDGSIRSEANLTSFDNIVLESDKATPDKWLAMIVQERLAIRALYTSGNRSIHALIRTGASTKTQFNEVRREFLQKYVPLGADAAALSSVRLTRLPGVVRKDNGREQQLLYLNPKPIARAIYTNETASV